MAHHQPSTHHPAMGNRRQPATGLHRPATTGHHQLVMGTRRQAMCPMAIRQLMRRHRSPILAMAIHLLILAIHRLTQGMELHPAMGTRLLAIHPIRMEVIRHLVIHHIRMEVIRREAGVALEAVATGASTLAPSTLASRMRKSLEWASVSLVEGAET